MKEITKVKEEKRITALALADLEKEKQRTIAAELQLVQTLAKNPAVAELLKSRLMHGKGRRTHCQESGNGG